MESQADILECTAGAQSGRREVTVYFSLMSMGPTTAAYSLVALLGCTSVITVGAVEEESVESVVSVISVEDSVLALFFSTLLFPCSPFFPLEKQVLY